jgi:hypothetical protein
VPFSHFIGRESTMKKWIRAISCAVILGVAAQPNALAAEELPGCCYDLRRCNAACAAQYQECKGLGPYTPEQCAEAREICFSLCVRDWP